jgi:hypothetical protein
VTTCPNERSRYIVVRKRGNVLEGFLVYFKQDLEGRSQTSGLDLAPQATLVTTNTVHGPGHVAEVLFKFLLQDLWCGSAARQLDLGQSTDVCIRPTEQHSFVEFANVLCDVHYIVKSRKCPNFVFQVGRVWMIMGGEAVP